VGLRGGLHEEPDLVTAIPSLDQGVDRGLSGCARSENSDVVIGGMAAGRTHETSGYDWRSRPFVGCGEDRALRWLKTFDGGLAPHEFRSWLTPARLSCDERLQRVKADTGRQGAGQRAVIARCRMD
jgi:hypothetical protein